MGMCECAWACTCVNVHGHAHVHVATTAPDEAAAAQQAAADTAAVEKAAAAATAETAAQQAAAKTAAAEAAQQAAAVREYGLLSTHGLMALRAGGPSSIRARCRSGLVNTGRPTTPPFSGHASGWRTCNWMATTVGFRQASKTERLGCFQNEHRKHCPCSRAIVLPHPQRPPAQGTLQSRRRHQNPPMQRKADYFVRARPRHSSEQAGVCTHVRGGRVAVCSRHAAACPLRWPTRPKYLSAHQPTLRARYVLAIFARGL